jgi:NADPH:quinone reductase-like Zn-dependent oxidoreductase
MKTEAIVLRAHGGPEVLVRETIDIRDPGPREVRVRVRAVALNHLDLWVRRGLPNLKLEYPHRLGADVVGEVEAIGPGAHGATLGARVVVSPGVSFRVRTTCAGNTPSSASTRREATRSTSSCPTPTSCRTPATCPSPRSPRCRSSF